MQNLHNLIMFCIHSTETRTFVMKICCSIHDFVYCTKKLVFNHPIKYISVSDKLSFSSFSQGQPFSFGDKNWFLLVLITLTLGVSKKCRSFYVFSLLFSSRSLTVVRKSGFSPSGRKPDFLKTETNARKLDFLTITTASI